MRRLSVLFFVLICVILLPSCGTKPATPDEPITLFPPHSETATENSAEVTSTGSALANKTYGQTTEQKPIGLVTDYSETYRSEASYTLESVAMDEAKRMFADSVSQPETLSVTQTQLIGCAADGENEYYRIYIHASYRVETGEEIRRAAYFDIGVRQSDQAAFDASEVLPDVFLRYSIYKEETVFFDVRQPDPYSPDFEAAAMRIAAAQLKAPQSGKAVRAVRRDDLCDEPRLSVYDVLCVGVNDYGVEIPCVYTVYMTLENDVIRQSDPAQLRF